MTPAIKSIIGRSLHCLFVDLTFLGFSYHRVDEVTAHFTAV